MIPGVLPIKKPQVKKDENQINNPIKENLSEYEEKLKKIRKQRDELIKNTIWIKEKYECQLKEKQIGMSSGTEMTQRKFEQWLQYWKDLRNLPNRIKNGEINIDDVIFPKQPT